MQNRTLESIPRFAGARCCASLQGERFVAEARFVGLRWTLVVVLVVLSFACESSKIIDVELTLAPGVSAPYTTQDPGILMLDLGTGDPPEPVSPICGSESGTLLYHADLGFGCLAKEERGTEVHVDAWIESLPQAWNAGAFCQLERLNDVSGIVLTEAVTGDPSVDPSSVLAASPEPSWPQGSGVGIWMRDLSPCGGTADVSLTVQ